MAEFLGTTGTDTLTGTAGDDILTPWGTTMNTDREVLRGLDGADTYNLQRSSAGTYNFLIDDRGTDGAIDSITNAGAMYQSASFGFSTYATAERINGNLIIHLPNKPHRFHSPAKPSYDIKIKDQYGDGHIETLQAGGVTYNLAIGGTGTATEDIMAGSKLADVFSSGDGNDWLFGNRGGDYLDAGAGDDIVFGGKGRDTITAASGNNLIFGEAGNDRITTGDGADRIDSGAGNDRIFAGAGNDRIEGGAGNDVLKGQAGHDVLLGGDGNDRLFGGNDNDVLDAGGGTNFLRGGKGGDSYVISVADPNINTISDKGDAPFDSTFATAKDDEIRLTGYTTFLEGVHSIDLKISGQDLVIIYGNDPLTPGQTSQIIIQNQFLNARFAIEKLSFGVSSSASNFHFSNLTGDNFTHSVHSGPDVGANDFVFGTDGDDVIYGGFGTNILLGGEGSDRFIFEDEEDNRSGFSIILDFDLNEDTLDFTEISGLTRAGLTISDNSFGNAEISSIYSTIELKGIAVSEIVDSIFDFA